MRAVRYIKPNMTNLKGKKGKAILAEIRNMKAKPMDDIRRDADACMNRILARRKDRRYEDILKSDDKKEVGCMCDVAERLERKGIEKGRLSEIFDSVQSEDYSVERGAQKANMSIPEFEKAMKSAGYKIPTYA